MIDFSQYSFWNPNNWSPPPTEGRIYLDDYADKFVTVDYEDYLWAVQWRWQMQVVRSANCELIYASRSAAEYVNGVRVKHYTIYLHREILIRAAKPKPSRLHKLADHRDRDTLNCRRANLRWATHAMNVKNRRKLAT